MTLLWSAYRAAAPLLGALAPAALRLVPRDERPLWPERLGAVVVPGGAHAWVHAASLGEASGVGPLVEELLRLEPRARLQLTATTRTGRRRLAGLGPPAALAPLDTPQAVARFLAGVAPRRLLLLETELWPHWLLGAEAFGIPAAVVSARLSERSLRGYARLGAPLRRLVRGLEAVLCQSDADAARWAAIGADPARVEVTGNLKHDAVPRPAPSRRAARVELGLDPERPLLVLGSLRPGEARALARAWSALPAALRAGWQVAAVPRHGRARAELEAEARAAGGDGAWRWDAASGVLARYYAAAEVAFVGGSLSAFGGHNPMEPAACGAAVLMGPHHAAQADAVAALAAREAIVLAAPGEALEHALAALLGDPAEREARGAAAAGVAESRRGVARRTVARLAARGLWPAEAV